jgi:hypothetical protein
MNPMSASERRANHLTRFKAKSEFQEKGFLAINRVRSSIGNLNTIVCCFNVQATTSGFSPLSQWSYPVACMHARRSTPTVVTRRELDLLQN